LKKLRIQDLTPKAAQRPQESARGLKRNSSPPDKNKEE